VLRVLSALPRLATSPGWLGIGCARHAGNAPETRSDSLRLRPRSTSGRPFGRIGRRSTRMSSAPRHRCRREPGRACWKRSAA
jgi:hypothetical protein